MAEVGSDAGTPDVAVDAPPLPEVEWSLRIDADWTAGYCAAVTVTNVSDGRLDWAVTIEVDGTLTDYWNARTEDAGGSVHFIGEVYNQSLDPGAETSFGFCAAR